MDVANAGAVRRPWDEFRGATEARRGYCFVWDDEDVDATTRVRQR